MKHKIISYRQDELYKGTGPLYTKGDKHEQFRKASRAIALAV